jgi:hypothetical protein
MVPFGTIPNVTQKALSKFESLSLTDWHHSKLERFSVKCRLLSATITSLLVI